VLARRQGKIRKVKLSPRKPHNHREKRFSACESDFSGRDGKYELGWEVNTCRWGHTKFGWSEDRPKGGPFQGKTLHIQKGGFKQMILDEIRGGRRETLLSLLRAKEEVSEKLDKDQFGSSSDRGVY